MKRAPLLFSLTLLVACAAIGQAKDPASDEGEPESDSSEICAKVACVHDVLIRLKLKDGDLFEKRFESLPVVQPNGVAVYAGQKVLFEAELVGNELANLKMVDEVGNPEITISAELTQSENGSM
ncbi:MAG: hypothetical protein WBS20_10995, partial [Lysobacterales bacterium]